MKYQPTEVFLLVTRWPLKLAADNLTHSRSIFKSFTCCHPAVCLQLATEEGGERGGLTPWKWAHAIPIEPPPPTQDTPASGPHTESELVTPHYKATEGGEKVPAVAERDMLWECVSGRLRSPVLIPRHRPVFSGGALCSWNSSNLLFLVWGQYRI